MPQTKERKEYMRLYRLKNKEENKEYNRLYLLKNKEKIHERDRLKYLKNKEEKLERNRLYRQTEQGKKCRTIHNWRRQGILCFDWDLLYDIFLKTTKCEFCEVELTIGRYTTSTTKCLDHEHSITDRFNIRGILCHSCNVKDVLK